MWNKCKGFGLIDAVLPPEQLQVSVASPVALTVSDDQGRRTGADPATGQVLLEIPGATYSGKAGEPQSVTILWPSGGYRASLVGTGKGEYHLTIASGVTGEVVLSQQGQVEKGQIVSADVAMVAVSDTEVRPLALIAEAPVGGRPETAPAAQEKQASETPWALWGGGIAAIALTALAGTLLWRRARSSKKA